MEITAIGLGIGGVVYILFWIVLRKDSKHLD
jgi:hypothetical protein